MTAGIIATAWGAASIHSQGNDIARIDPQLTATIAQLKATDAKLKKDDAALQAAQEQLCRILGGIPEGSACPVTSASPSPTTDNRGLIAQLQSEIAILESERSTDSAALHALQARVNALEARSSQPTVQPSATPRPSPPVTPGRLPTLAVPTAVCLPPLPQQVCIPPR